MCENPECPVCPPEEENLVAVDPTYVNNAALNFTISNEAYEAALRRIQRNRMDTTPFQWNWIDNAGNTVT